MIEVKLMSVTAAEQKIRETNGVTVHTQLTKDDVGFLRSSPIFKSMS